MYTSHQPHEINIEVFLEGFRPGAIKRLGFDYASVSAREPRILYVSISGFGQTGEMRDVAATNADVIATALTLGAAGSVAAQAQKGQTPPEIDFVKVWNDGPESFEDMVWYLDEPVAGAAVFPQYYLSRLAAAPDTAQTLPSGPVLLDDAGWQALRRICANADTGSDPGPDGTNGPVRRSDKQNRP